MYDQDRSEPTDIIIHLHPAEGESCVPVRWPAHSRYEIPPGARQRPPRGGELTASGSSSGEGRRRQPLPHRQRRVKCGARRSASGRPDHLQLQPTVRALRDRLLPAQRLQDAAPGEGLPAAAAQLPQNPQAAPCPVRPRLQRLQQEAGGGLQLSPGRQVRTLMLSPRRVPGCHAWDPRRLPSRPPAPALFRASAPRPGESEDCSTRPDTVAGPFPRPPHSLRRAQNATAAALGLGAVRMRKKPRRGSTEGAGPAGASGNGAGELGRRRAYLWNPRGPCGACLFVGGVRPKRVRQGGAWRRGGSSAAALNRPPLRTGCIKDVRDPVVLRDPTTI